MPSLQEKSERELIYASFPDLKGRGFKDAWELKKNNERKDFGKFKQQLYSN